MKDPIVLSLSRRTFGFGIGAGLIGALVGCGKWTRFDLRFRLIAGVKLGGKIHTGSSVIAIREYGSPRVGVGGSAGVKARGQAIVIDLKKHGLLFGLINSPAFTPGFTVKQTTSYLNEMLPPDTERELRGDSYGRWVAFARLKGNFSLRPEQQPVLVRFPDMTNAQSAQLVTANTIASIYSTDAEILPAQFQIPCDEPTTYGIDRQLPLLRSNGLYQNYQPRHAFGRYFSDQLRPGCFVANDFSE